jgi:hypothetical protein
MTRIKFMSVGLIVAAVFAMPATAREQTASSGGTSQKQSMRTPR